jgi:hypothetical protein
MRRVAFVAAALLVFFTVSTARAEISGDYVETRSADVYTGQCFANGEVGLVGDQAILGWHVDKGTWNGVRLDGLSIVGVVKARATLGDPYGNPYPAKSVLIVDDRATAQQSEALQGFAHHMAGALFDHVARVEIAPIEVAVSRDHAHHGAALLRAGTFATVQTRPLNDHDHLCGNEVTFYPPLTEVAHSTAAVALTDEYSGPSLGVTWQTHGKRSAFVGTFAQNETVQSASAR